MSQTLNERLRNLAQLCATTCIALALTVVLIAAFCTALLLLSDTARIIGSCLGENSILFILILVIAIQQWRRTYRI